jgi:predicted N-acetyltransferase YhbS
LLLSGFWGRVLKLVRSYSESKGVIVNDGIELDYLAVHPKNKGKGIATALVMSGIEAANKMGLPVFCMAYKAGLGIYSRCGFKEVERIIQDTAQWGFEGEYGAYFMVYDNPNPS